MEQWDQDQWHKRIERQVNAQLAVGLLFSAFLIFIVICLVLAILYFLPLPSLSLSYVDMNVRTNIDLCVPSRSINISATIDDIDDIGISSSGTPYSCANCYDFFEYYDHEWKLVGSNYLPKYEEGGVCLKRAPVATLKFSDPKWGTYELTKRLPFWSLYIPKGKHDNTPLSFVTEGFDENYGLFYVFIPFKDAGEDTGPKWVLDWGGRFCIMPDDRRRRCKVVGW